MKQDNIEEKVRIYLNKIAPKSRYASFDYCFNYFKKEQNLENDMEKSCLILGFYLASWGMYRGSSFLLKEKSLKHIESTILYISELKKDKSILPWEIDIDNYTDKNINKIIEIYDEIKKRLIEGNNNHLILITKILLGVFGFVPAFDENFCAAFKNISIENNEKCRFTVLNHDSLDFLRKFYQKNKEIIDHFSKKTFTFGFYDGEYTKLNYSKAKIIDMYGFQIGAEINNKKRRKNDLNNKI